MAQVYTEGFGDELLDVLTELQLSAWTGGAESVVEDVLPNILTANGLPPQPRSTGPPPPIFRVGTQAAFPDDVRIQFPRLEKAASNLLDAKIVKPEKFYEMVREAREHAFTITQDIGDHAIGRIQHAIQDTMAKGGDFTDVVKQVGEAFDKSTQLSDAYLEMVYRTNVASSWSNGQRQAVEAPMVADAFPYRAYFATVDDRTREEHFELNKLGLNGTRVYANNDPVWSIFEPPWDFNAVLPCQELQGSFSIGTKRRYEGQSIHFVTDAGRQFAVTPKHPILTNRGFVVAEHLEKRDQVLAYSMDVQQSFRGRQEVYRPPSSVGQVFNSLASFSRLISVKGANLDFHGEPVGDECYIDIVASDGELLLAHVTDLSHVFSHSRFTIPDLDLVDISSSAASGEFARLCRSASTCSPHSRQMGGDSLSLVSQCRRFGAVSYLDATLNQSDSDIVAASTAFFRDLVERHPSVVFCDQIASVEFRHYDGPVYDFQSPDGHYTLNGIVVSNCRCGWQPYTVRQAARAGVQEAIAWIQRATDAARGGNIGGTLASTAPSPRQHVPMPPFEPSEDWLPGRIPVQEF